jgi:hypothetical protein
VTADLRFAEGTATTIFELHGVTPAATPYDVTRAWIAFRGDDPRFDVPYSLRQVAKHLPGPRVFQVDVAEVLACSVDTLHRGLRENGLDWDAWCGLLRNLREADD